MKNELCTNTLLYHPKNLPFELHTDASDIGIGAALVQKENGKEIPVQFFSKKLSEAEGRYDTLKKELLAIYLAVKKFRPFLYGRSFRVLTDHKPLIGFLKNKSSEHSPVVGRIISYLSEFDMLVEYKKGETNVDADALSRLIEVNAVVEVGTLEEAQKIDPITSRLLDSKAKKNYVVKEGLLYHKEGDLERIVVPGSYILEIISSYHGKEGGMHQSPERTFKSIAKKYYWSGMRKSIEEYCRRCKQCVQKKKTKENHGVVANLPIGGPWEIVFMDCIGPYPMSEKGNRYIIAAIDSFSKNIEVRAVPTIETTQIISFITEEIMARHGVPREVITDNGSNFISNGIKEFYKKLNIVQKLSTPYNPQGNGVIERFNRTLTTAIRIMSDGSGDDREWDKLLSGIVLAYRNTPHSGTNETPFFLEHGRDPTMPIDLSFISEDNVSYEVRKDKLKKLRELWEIAEKRALWEQKERNRALSKWKKDITFKVDDLVWVHMERTQGSQKLVHKWKGPMRISKKYNDQAYEVKDLQSDITHKVNIRRLRSYFKPFIEDALDKSKWLKGKNVYMPMLYFNSVPGPEPVMPERNNVEIPESDNVVVQEVEDRRKVEVENRDVVQVEELENQQIENDIQIEPNDCDVDQQSIDLEVDFDEENDLRSKFEEEDLNYPISESTLGSDENSEYAESSNDDLIINSRDLNILSSDFEDLSLEPMKLERKRRRNEDWEKLNDFRNQMESMIIGSRKNIKRILIDQANTCLRSSRKIDELESSLVYQRHHDEIRFATERWLDGLESCHLK